MTTQLLEETAATASDQGFTTEPDASTVDPQLKTQISIWRPGLVVAGALLAAALASGGSQFTLSTGPRRRLDGEFSESGTAPFECDAEILDEVRQLFDRGAAEFFQDGLHSHFSRGLLDLLARNGGVALHAIARYLVSGLAKEDVGSEALRWIADYHDPETASARGRLLRRSLRSSSPRVRDGAVFGVSIMDDPRALPFLEQARQTEPIHELRRLIDTVIEQLARLPMPLLLRTVRENRRYKAPAAAWLERGDVPADPLGDLATSQNALSVWHVEPDRSNLERVVRAVAIGKQRVDSAGWVLFDSELLGPLGIGVVKAPGGTNDEGANAWHRDLVDLSGNKLVALARVILERGESGTIPKKRMTQLIEDGIRNRELPDGLRGQLQL